MDERCKKYKENISSQLIQKEPLEDPKGHPILNGNMM
jgi:hypothetical protein